MTKGPSLSQAHGGQILIESLVNLGLTTGFGVPGESYLAALDGMVDRDGRKVFDFTLCRNEGGAAFMAASYGKLTGKPGICFVTRGPGATNAAIGVHTAMQDSSPMILFVGQIGTDVVDREAFQEVDYRDVFSGLAKWVTQINECERLPELVGRAYAKALSGRPGPVVVALPEDMLSAMSDVAACQPFDLPKPAAADEQISVVIDKLRHAQSPVIIAGGGGWNDAGRRDLAQFAAHMQVPVMASFRCHDVMDNTHSCYVGDAGIGASPQASDRLRNADLLIAINIRFGEMVTQNWQLFDVPKMNPYLVHSHISADEIGKIYQPDIAIQSCPNKLVHQLLAHAGEPVGAQARRDYVAGEKALYDAGLIPPKQTTKLDLASVIATIEDLTPSDAIITHGAGNFAIWPDKFMRYGQGRRLLAPQAGAMGYGLPAAIAAFVAEPTRTVICFAGDGDIQMNLAELGTAMQIGAKPIILIYNNGTYGTIRMHQERHYPERISGTTLVNPDFMALASAYGFAGHRIETAGEFTSAFQAALQASTGTIIELMQDAEQLTPTMNVANLRAQS